MKSKLIENVGYFSIALILALTLVLSFSAVDFPGGITACAAESPSLNGLYNYPGSASIVVPNYDFEAVELYSNIEGSVDTYDVNVYITIDDDYLFNSTDALLQFIFYVERASSDDDSLYLTSVCLPLSYFAIASDLGYADNYFAYGYEYRSDNDGSNPYIKVIFHQFLDDFTFSDWEYIFVYDIRLIEPQTNNNNSTSEGLLSIVGDGISFGFESIADGITYTVENLFFNEERHLSDFSIIVFWLTGVSLALAVAKYVLRLIFSFGGSRL